MKNQSENYSANPQADYSANPQADYSTNTLKHCLDRITYNYNSIILGEYYITYHIYKSTYQDYPTEYAIKITANLPNQPNIQWSSWGYRKS